MLEKAELMPVWSNVPFVLPAIIAISKGLWLYGVLILVAATISLLHHMDNKLNLKNIDQLFALSVIAANLYVLSLSEWKQPNFILALLFVALAFYFFFKGKNESYDIYHSLWHMCSVAITLLCVLAY